MKQLISLPLICLFLVFIFSSGCKEIPKTELDKTKTADTTKKTTINNDDVVSKISKFRADNEAKLNAKTLTKKDVTLKGDKIKEDISQKWEKLDAYYDGDKLVRIQTYPHKGSERTEEFYIMDGKLAFAFIQDKGTKKEGKDTGEPGKEFYFDNDKLIKYVNTTKEEVKNLDEEKKMYESKLPYEVKDLIEIIKAVK